MLEYTCGFGESENRRVAKFHTDFCCYIGSLVTDSAKWLQAWIRTFIITAVYWLGCFAFVTLHASIMLIFFSFMQSPWHSYMSLHSFMPLHSPRCRAYIFFVTDLMIYTVDIYILFCAEHTFSSSLIWWYIFFYFSIHEGALPPDSFMYFACICRIFLWLYASSLLFYCHYVFA